MIARSTTAQTLPERAYAQYGKALHRYLMRRLQNAQSAQDLAQEAYLRLVRLKGSELVRAPQAYLFRIASNLVYEMRQRERRDVVTFDSRLVDHTAERVSDPSTCETGEKINRERQLEAVLAQLPPLYAAILVMKKRDGLSMQEIARALNISIYTVKKYLFRAVTQCRKHMCTNIALAIVMTSCIGCSDVAVATAPPRQQCQHGCEPDQPRFYVDTHAYCCSRDTP